MEHSKSEMNFTITAHFQIGLLFTQVTVEMEEKRTVPVFNLLKTLLTNSDNAENNQESKSKDLKLDNGIQEIEE